MEVVYPVTSAILEHSACTPLNRERCNNFGSSNVYRIRTVAVAPLKHLINYTGNFVIDINTVKKCLKEIGHG